MQKEPKMRVLAVFVATLGLVSAVLLPSGARAGIIGAPGPNPSWTEMQKFEWDLGYMARAAQMCGAYDEAGVLHHLARMSPYGNIGLGAVTGDGFARPVCGSIREDAKALAADAKRIQARLEATYNCQGEGCYGLYKRDSWTDHACADSVTSHLASRAIAKELIGEVFIHNARLMGAVQEYQVRIRLKNCEGSLYIDLKQSCAVKKDYVRGDCTIAGVERY